MSDFYKVQLRRYPADRGFTGGNRPLTNSEEALSGIERSLAAERADRFGRFTDADDTVVFDVSPTVTETRNVNYRDEAIPGPNGIVVYATTANRQFTISARFVSRTIDEALLNFKYVNLLRSWLVPQSPNGRSGRPPTVRLNGYKKNFFNIPVVLSSLSINFPEDVDYIETTDATVPIIQTVDISLIEAHGLDELRVNGSRVDSSADFDLAEFKLGMLPGY